MDVEQLIDDTVDLELQAWLRKWPNAIEALNHIGELFDKLKEPAIWARSIKMCRFPVPYISEKDRKYIRS